MQYLAGGVDSWTKLVGRTIGLFFPRAAARYVAARTMLRRGYMAGALTGPDRLWNPTAESADMVNSASRKVILSRARDLMRNSPYMVGGIQKIVNNVVYNGIRPQFKSRDDEKLELMFNQWAQQSGFYEMQQTAVAQMIVDGEVLFVHSASKRLREKKLCPMNLRIYECDYLDETFDDAEKNIWGGIQHDDEGWPVRYRMYKQHPSESQTYQTDSYWVDADSVFHLYRPKRAGQRRGISELAAIIMEMRDFTEYQNNERIAARLASAFGVMLESPYPEHQTINPITGEGQEQNAVPKFIEAGRIDILPTGLRPHVVENKRPGANYEPYTRVSLRGVSAGLNLSYENFSNDFSTATYASARSATLEERRGYKMLQDTMIRRFCMPAAVAWWNYAKINGMVKGEMPQAEWQTPGWSWVDPQKDARAAELKLKMGITTRRKLAAEAGDDIDDINREIQDDKFDYTNGTFND